ncbi:MAG: PIN domain-containing protein [Rhizobiaceae bacterium]
MYLLDTNVISAVAPTKASIDFALVEWIRKSSSRLFLSVVTASEVGRGVAKLEREGRRQKAEALRRWWGQIEHHYSRRLLEFDLKASHAAGMIMDRARGHAPGYQDIALAATASVHGLTVLTANERHFSPLGVDFLNPFKALPPL